jgi:hypothetical protein
MYQICCVFAFFLICFFITLLSKFCLFSANCLVISWMLPNKKNDCGARVGFCE